MAEWTPDDLGKEIDRLWAKVAAPSVETWDPFVSGAAADPVTGHQVAWETMALLKRQHRHETAYWAEVLEAKERALRAGQDRLAYLELEVGRLREKIRLDEARFLADGVDIQGKAQAAMKAVVEERSVQEREQKGLRELLEQIRERAAAEAAVLRQEREHWEKKEQQYLIDIKDLQALASRREEEASRSADQARGVRDGLTEAKNALEKTLSELLRERQVREESEREREKALKKVDEVQKHFEELSKIWEEERAQWRELWDRERSTWETQRGEFSAWEEKLRSERETWLAEVQSKEQDQARFTEQISRSLRESSEATSKLSSMMKGLASPVSVLRLPPWVKQAVLAAALACAAAVPIWRYATRLHLKVQTVRMLDLSNPTALAYDGNLLWAAEWDGRFLAFDPQDPAAPARTARVSPAGPYRPVALAFGDGNLWSADAAQARILRHKAEAPEKILASRPSPGPAPTALAYDGHSLWSFDAANKALYRHGIDEGSYKSFALEEDVVAVAMAWVKDRLWIIDAKSRDLCVFDFKLDAFRLQARYPFSENAVGLAPVRSGERAKSLWVLAGPGRERSGHAFVQYAY
ncbi:MAG: hypothetical protein HY077_07575 [Elusimicrobia bacterium]|nr:hypothetical protein [Elusimicrobiota bacterium]